MEQIDVKKVIKRLKRELGIKYDADLARKLGIERTYLGAMKSRGEFTGTAWDSILSLCNQKDIDINFVVFGRSSKSDPESQLVSNLIRHIVAEDKDAGDLIAQVQEARHRYAEDLPADVYREELLRFAQKLIEAAL